MSVAPPRTATDSAFEEDIAGKQQEEQEGIESFTGLSLLLLLEQQRKHLRSRQAALSPALLPLRILLLLLHWKMEQSLLLLLLQDVLETAPSLVSPPLLPIERRDSRVLLLAEELLPALRLELLTTSSSRRTAADAPQGPHGPLLKGSSSSSNRLNVYQRSAELLQHTLCLLGTPMRCARCCRRTPPAA